MIKDIVYSKFPVLDFHQKFILRQPTILQNDIDSMYEVYNDPSVIKFVPDGCIPKGMDGAKEEARYYSNLYLFQKSIYWFIAEKDTNKTIGTCGFPSWDRYNEKVELSYNILGIYHNQGIVTQAIKNVLWYCFDVMKLKRVESQLDPMNIASIKVLEKNGFTKDGILPKYRRYKNNQYIDVLLMSMIDDKYFKNKT